MKISELRTLSLRQIEMQLREGKTASSEITQLLLEQIHRTEPKLKAYVTVCERGALEQAEAADRKLKAGQAPGMLHGVPVSIKDLFETEGVLTTCGSKLRQSYVPKSDCTVVKRLKREGAIVLGKTNTHEFALGAITPPTRNPWNLDHIPGGSSGGSAASIAACSSIAATGSDTGGSIRIPCSFCGVVGLKPTYGRVSRAGVFPESWSLDHIGPITRSVEDAALMLGVMAGHDPLDPTSSDEPVPDYLRRLRDPTSGLMVGVPSNYFFERCDQEVSKSVQSAIEILMQLGCRRVDFRFPRSVEIVAAHIAIDQSESSSYHRESLAQRPGDFQPDVRLLLEQGMFISAVDYIQAQRFRGLVFNEVMRLFERFDVIVTPTQPITAPLVGEQTIRFADGEETVDSAVSRFDAPFNLLGLPSLTVPCGFSNDGLPIGMQIVGRPFDESTVLQVGYAYENATDWYSRFPDIP
jgi:aspartyl-tRNA(Asn)/glutamyl-tRNA(Gln) amidotransferase subunit A